MIEKNDYKQNIHNDCTDIYEPPNEILPYLYIGSYNSINTAKLNTIGIKYIIVAGEECIRHEHLNFNYIHINLKDDVGEDITIYLNSAIDFIDHALLNNGKVLVHCYEGKSRSATIVIAYLMIKKNMSFDEAYKFVKDKHAKTNPNRGYLRQLRNTESADVSQQPM